VRYIHSVLTRRSFMMAAASSLTLSRLGRVDAQTRPLPSRAQLEWQRDELALFLHFGVNTFTDREWGDGTEDPAIFNPARLDARQWAASAKAAGAKAMILTAKHHDGFCLWPTKTTTHSVASSSFRGGRGDVVREFVDACRAFTLKAGLYLSPWDRNASVYGDSPRYNEFYRAQLTELLTEYGRIDEVWFDGANGEGPNGKKQTYDWPTTWALVRTLQPEAVMFSDAGPDVRWIGNENGVAGETNWSTVDPAVVPVPGVSGPAVTKMLREGDPNGGAWRPGETDVSIRPGWFYHSADDAKVRSVDNLVNLYFTSVGRNSKLLLNVPPTKDGLLHDVDVDCLTGMRAKLDEMFKVNLAGSDRVVTISIADLREDIAYGQVVSGYRLEGSIDGEQWQLLSKGTTIGHRKLDRFAPTPVRQTRLTITDSVATPRPVALRLYA
jgi:alpha-L-fucosidase